MCRFSSVSQVASSIITPTVVGEIDVAEPRCARLNSPEQLPRMLSTCFVCVCVCVCGVLFLKNGQDLANPPLIARLSEAESGRVMEVFGSQPAAQLYSANYLSTGEIFFATQV